MEERLEVKMINKEDLVRDMGIAINEWDKAKLIALVTEGMQAGFTPFVIANEILVPTLQKACREIDSHDITFPELVLLADTIKAALDLLVPQIKTSLSGGKEKGRVVIGTVKGDIHDLGKTLVAAIFQSGGFRVVDLGRDVSTKDFIAAAKKEKAQIVAASTLMTPTLFYMEELIREIRARKMKVKTIIGGWATSPEFAQRIGANAWAEDALEGLFKLDRLIQELGDE
jgi:5-methyltetrahydrofolate--homocysteine methyltransferase